MSVTIPLRSVNSRSELRLALLAAAESCWFYAIALTLGTMAGFPRAVSPLGIFVMYMAGLLAGRFLPRLPQSWRLLQMLTVLIAFFALLAAIRVGLYPDLNLTDVSWLPAYLSGVFAIFEHVNSQVLSTVILVLAFIRALGFAQRPLTLWVVGFEFRLGIVIFFVLAIFAGLATNVNFTLWIYLYFAFFLISIAFARIEDAGQLGALGGRWAAVMLTMLAITLLVGFALTHVLTLRAVNAFFAFFAPVAFVLEAILLIIALPFIYLFDLLFQMLLPLLQLFGQSLSRLFPAQIQPNPDAQRMFESLAHQLESLIPYLRLIGIIFVLLGVAWLIARALNRRMTREEEEMFARESVGLDDTSRLDKRRRSAPPRVGRREIHAENVRRIYAALQAQAEALGLKRRDAETPLEYLPRLSARFPALTIDFQTITHAYVAVHYAQQSATDAQVRELRAIWQHTQRGMKDESKSSNKRK